MKIATAEIVKSVDNFCINYLKIPGIILMENAAIKILKNLDLDRVNSFTIVCGKGNNGGDGFAVARHLIAMKKDIEIFLVGGEQGMSQDCNTNYSILKNIGVNINFINNVEDINELREVIQKSDITIDAIFGTGLSRKIEGIYDSVISVINENSRYTLAIDIPSGLNSNNGEILGNCIRANKTVCLALYKKGFLSYGTDKVTGDIIVEDIGIPEEVINKFHENEFIMDKNMIKKYTFTREKYSHKGDYGRALIIAGSKGYTGAAYIATEAAVRTGAGLVTLCTNKDVYDTLSYKLVEAMSISFDDKDKFKQLLYKSNSIAIGPGLGDNEVTFNIVKKTIENSNCPIVMDADAINVLKNKTDILNNKKSEVVLTPHLGEMARLTNMSIEYIKKNRIKVAKEFAKKYKVIVLLKGYNTIITNGDKLIINPTGNSAMASGGMGDCLTGIITSFIAQGYEPMMAAAIGAFIHGYCGEKLSNNMFCVNATHILDKLPIAIKEIQNL
ncbi:NAD(P)H-hydrate epimerase [Clostridium tetanomorphum]|uniref:bifunctional ADP-dependent NAD(P)H-hydrate dehydratase/NAD(P)H-hydrate epimerase n=1 Tax=Clostridium tetanomorphum TaxID=1553 RepID=UPI000445E2C0|nr:bifunctional ADP-dependent NAD(P)H-hydrate dehydratase/NAD(P)H-hydrate epimerase [Clostridium tetanomorphum]KAJ53220.1 sugar kinase [Clostridium tetanomorphum DSM 665]MBP1863622.1 NAD(P)H-hydrate epimerase [Clostridium tetanomorphum]NRS86198.1 NAD(P)H-hydrate epimerase [Clostridium tetanomorphum]SQC00797.1 sugar kinase [Clostridium tetanomorphum]